MGVEAEVGLALTAVVTTQLQRRVRANVSSSSSGEAKERNGGASVVEQSASHTATPLPPVKATARQTGWAGRDEPIVSAPRGGWKRMEAGRIRADGGVVEDVVVVVGEVERWEEGEVGGGEWSDRAGGMGEERAGGESAGVGTGVAVGAGGEVAVGGEEECVSGVGSGEMAEEGRGRREERRVGGRVGERERKV